MFSGSMVALVTPMQATGKVDEQKLRELVERQVAAGTDAIVVTGTTGESVTLTEGERRTVISIAIETVKKRVPVIVGTGTNSTLETIYKTEKAMELGADACLIVTPYYNKPTQEGLYEHYRSIADAVQIPQILYNVPGRTCVNLSVETVARLCSIPNIVGIKDATGDLARGRELLAACKESIALYSGDDASALAFMLQGGKGVISVTANIAPDTMHEMCKAALAGDFQKAGELNTKLMPLHKNLFVESNPIPVKWALKELGWIEDGIRLPLTVLSEKYHEQIREAMRIGGVIECVQ